MWMMLIRFIIGAIFFAGLLLLMVSVFRFNLIFIRNKGQKVIFKEALKESLKASRSTFFKGILCFVIAFLIGFLYNVIFR